MAGVSYLMCGTPRTGSTLLCGLRESTGLAGRPQSYFREPDERELAGRLGVPVAADGSFDYRRFARAVRAEGSSPNGVFAARVMWGTMSRVVDGLAPGPRTGRDVTVLEDAFGPLRLVYLRRQDVLGQAVSWARAEQTGYWQEDDRPAAEPRLDLGRIEQLVRTVQDHDAGWARWFAAQDRAPHRVTYEDVTADPGRAVLGILDHLGLELPAGWRPAPRQRRQADHVNAAWVRAYREAHPR
jgi:trehalose 2-sulfotransferase